MDLGEDQKQRLGVDKSELVIVLFSGVSAGVLDPKRQRAHPLQLQAGCEVAAPRHLQDGHEAVEVDLEVVQQRHHPRVLQVFLDVVFPDLQETNNMPGFQGGGSAETPFLPGAHQTTGQNLTGLADF